MNPEQHHLQHKNQQESQEIRQAQEQSQQALEFATPEEMLRHDVAHTEVPAKVEQRLVRSLGREPVAQRPWWRRLFNC